MKHFWNNFKKSYNEKRDQQIQNPEDNDFSKLFPTISLGLQYFTLFILKNTRLTKIAVYFKIFYVGSILLSLLLQIIPLFENIKTANFENRLDQTVEYCQRLIPGMYLVSKLYFSFSKRNDLIYIVDSINITFKNSHNNMNAEKQKMVKKTVKESIFINDICAIVMIVVFSSCIGQMVYKFIIAPLVLFVPRQLAMDIKYGLVARETLLMSPIYELVGVHQFIMTFCISLTLLSLCGFCITIFKHEFVLLELLKYDLGNLFQDCDSVTHENMLERIKTIGRDHQYVIGLHAKVHEVISKLFGGVILVASFVIPICIVQAFDVWEEDRFVKDVHVTIIPLVFAELFFPCWFGTKIIDLSSSASQAVYFCEWEKSKFYPKYKNSLMIIASRAKVPLKYTSFKIIVFNLELYNGIINYSYSLFNLLRSVKHQK